MTDENKKPPKDRKDSKEDKEEDRPKKLIAKLVEKEDVETKWKYARGRRKSIQDTAIIEGEEPSGSRLELLVKSPDSEQEPAQIVIGEDGKPRRLVGKLVEEEVVETEWTIRRKKKRRKPKKIEEETPIKEPELGTTDLLPVQENLPEQPRLRPRKHPTEILQSRLPGRRHSPTSFVEDEEDISEAPSVRTRFKPELHPLPASSDEDIRSQPSSLEIIYSQQIYQTFSGRFHWTSIEYLVASIVFIFDLTNFMKFPSLYMRFGGVFFLIPYLISTYLCSLPFLLFETIMGQFTREGMINSWKICPLLQGLGWFFIMQNFLNILWVQQVVSWAAQYVIEGIKSIAGAIPELANCNDYWNPGTLSCEEVQDKLLIPKTGSEYFRGVIIGEWSVTIKDLGQPVESRSTVEYNLSNYGSTNVHLIIGLGFGYFAAFIGIFYKQKYIVKLAILTVVFAVLTVGLLTVRGQTSPGSRKGMLFTIGVSDHRRLGWLSTWREGFAYSIYSPTIGLGIHLTLGSYKQFTAPLEKYCIHIISLEVFSSIFIAFVITMYAGVIIQYAGGRDFDEIERVPEMIYEIVPQVLAECPFVWVYLFIVYLALCFLGIYFTMITVVTICSSILDTLRLRFQRKKYTRSKRYRIYRIWAGSIIFSLFCLTIVTGTFNASIYINRIIDETRLSIPVLFGLLLFSLAGGWITGPQYLSDCHQAMTGVSCGVYWRICWKITVPGIILITLLSYIPLFFELELSEYRDRKLPWAAMFCGLLIRSIPLLPIPILMCKAYGSIDPKYRFIKWGLLLSPQHEHSKIIESGFCKRLKLNHYFSFGGQPMEGFVIRPEQDVEELIHPGYDIPIEDIPEGFILEERVIGEKTEERKSK